MRVTFRTGRTLRSLLTRVKYPLPMEKQSMVVYKISCSCGQTYIGKTIQQLETRLKKHKDACSRGLFERSTVAEYALKEDHPIKWDEVSVVDHAMRHGELLLKEALHIQMAAKNSTFNQDRGVELHDCWEATIRKCEGRGSFQPDGPPTRRKAPSYYPADTRNRLKAQESDTPDCI